MNFIGDFFSIGLVIVLGMFFFENKSPLDKASRYYVFSLCMTALNAVTDIVCVSLIAKTGIPLWVNMLANSCYFITNIMTTSCIGMFLFTKILEHSHSKHCMDRAIVGLKLIFMVYTAIIVLNIWTGWLFSFDAERMYHRGPLNMVGYIATLCQMVLVLICYFRNRKSATRSMQRVLIQTFPIVVVCIIVQRIYPDIMLNSFIMSMVNVVLFLTFHGRHLGEHSLTKLNDRHRFFEEIDARIKTGLKSQVFLINLKNYGAINKKYGHIFGDEVLYQFAFALERLIKNSSAFHMNSTVFALLIPYTGDQTAQQHLDTLLNRLEDGIDCGMEHINTEYVAVEYIVDNETDTAEFYEKLEYAAAKAYRQKNRYIRYTPALGDEISRRRYLVERLRKVDREHGFQVWYQPIRCLSTGEFCSLEALVRLIEPDGSIISPAEFIPLAEETGMVAPITWFVLEEVCKMLRAHPELGVNVGINLPMGQMLDSSFHVRFNSLVDSYDIDHSRICLEFTERAIHENFNQVQNIMETFSSEGFRFYLDDFGAGYSNFNCLLQLPFHFIKLDSKLVQLDLSRKKHGYQPLIEWLVGFMHELKLTVTAEGVETEEDLKLLEELKVDRVQGYVFAKPMPEKQLIEFYNEHRA